MKEQPPTYTPNHPLKKNADLIEQQGLMVFENVTSMPSYGERFTSPNLVVGICHEGYVKVEYDMQPVEFHPKEISVLYPNHIIYAYESSPDYRATLIVISNQFFNELRHHSLRRFQIEYLKIPAFKLSDQQYETMLHAVELLKASCQMNGKVGKDIMIDIIDIISRMTDYYRFQEKKPTQKVSNSEMLFYHFYDAIVDHHKESHEIQFYADLLCLTPKYFATVIKQTTGISASEWIAKFIIAKARHLLRQDFISIQEISTELGFAEQSSFSRYFRHYTGISPTQYRKANK